MFQNNSLVSVVAKNYVAQRYDAKWLDYVERTDPELICALLLCRSRYSVYECEMHGREALPQSCKLLDACPSDSRSYTNKIADDLLENVILKMYDSLNWRPVEFARYVFTLPLEEQVQIPYNSKGVSFLLECAVKTVNAYWNPKGDIELFMTAALHPFHSNNPFKGYFPHVDLTLLGVAYDRSTGQYIRLNFASLVRSKMAFKRKRKIELERFVKALNRRIVLSDIPVLKRDYHYSYLKGTSLLRNKLHYSYRRAVSDAYDVVAEGGLEWNDKERCYYTWKNRKVDSEWAYRLLHTPKNLRLIRHYGGLSDGRKGFHFTNIVGKKLEPKKIRTKDQRQVRCPKCDEPMRLVFGFNGLSKSQVEAMNIPILEVKRKKVKSKYDAW
ncbi:MAG: hypothetical protein ACYCQJ_05395 [Nitrososphaerales archaeon]